MPRFKPYSAIGVNRVPCARCARPSHAQWNVCADKINGRTQYRGLCLQCDIGMNELAMRFVFGGTREADIASYAAKASGASS